MCKSQSKQIQVIFLFVKKIKETAYAPEATVHTNWRPPMVFEMPTELLTHSQILFYIIILSSHYFNTIVHSAYTIVCGLYTWAALASFLL